MEKLKKTLLDRRFLGGVIGVAAVGAIVLLGLASRITVTDPAEATDLDVRGEELSIEDVVKFEKKYPQAVIRWDVPTSAGRIDSDSEELVLPDYTADDRAAVECFPRLKTVDATGSSDYPALLALKAERPDLDVRWTVPLGEKIYPSDTTELSVNGNDIKAPELTEALDRFPSLQTVRLLGGDYTVAEKAAIRQGREQIEFRWQIPLCGKMCYSYDTDISFAGDTSLTEESLAEIREAAGAFNNLRSVDLTDCGFESETLHELDVALGDTDVVWSFKIYGVSVVSTAEEISFDKRNIWDKGAEIEEKMVWMPHLNRVVMTECTIRDEDMDALNQRHPDVRFVWMVQIKWAGILTDSTFFIPYPESGARQFPSMAGIDALKYCPDLVALDLGHTNIYHLDFLDVMPNLKYLILADNWLLDIDKVGQLTELTWLELFKTAVNDISPILNCTKLEHLNICYITTPGDNVYETLRQMKSLKRLWCCGTLMTKEQLASLHEELPDCEIWDKMGDESSGSTWRYDEAYYEMRDAFHMYYMSWDGNTVKRQTPEQLAETHKKYWGY